MTKRVLGYSSVLSARAGESIDFKVSVTDGSPYRAQLVKLAGGFAMASDEAPLVEHVIPSDIDGVYAGRRQPVFGGSSVIVDSQNWPALSSFTIALGFLPTLPDGATQHLISHWDVMQDHGWSLALHHGHLVFAAGTGTERDLVRTPNPVARGVWHRAVIRIDAEGGRASLDVVRLVSQPWQVARPHESATAPFRVTLTPAAPVVIGARFAGIAPTGNPRTIDSFNGRLEAPVVYEGALEDLERDALLEGRRPATADRRRVADWDFSLGIDGTTVFDSAPHGHNGVTRNLPLRGVRGTRWTGDEHRWRHAPQEYGAIAFHTDDLGDCDWETDVTFTVPPDMQSGIYALRLRLGDSAATNIVDSSEDYIPFFVAAPRGTATADVALLMPTNTYLAYGNARCFHEWFLAQDLPIEEYDARLLNGPGLAGYGFAIADHPELGLSMYDHHADGTPVHFSSSQRPLLNMRPKGMMWNFSADLLIVEWLEETGIQYDVLTDDLLDREGSSVLEPYRVVVTGNHPEYTTTRELDALEGYLTRGGRLMYLGGNGYYWRCATHADVPGALELRRGRAGTGTWTSDIGESDLAFTGETGGLWRELGRPPQRLVGVGFTAEGTSPAPYRVLPGARDGRAGFLLAGVEADLIGESGVFGAAAGQEIDRSRESRGTPPHAVVIARSEGHGDDMITAIEELNPGYPVLEEHRADLFAEVVFFETAGGGAVFSVGSMAWCGSLRENGFRNDVARLSRNALDRLSDATPFAFPIDP